MFKKMGTITILLIIAAVLPLWAGGTQEELNDSSEPVVITVWNRNATLMGGAVEAFNAKMEKEGRNIRAEFTLVPYEEQSSRFLTALSAKTAPDVYAIDLILAPYFSKMGAWKDITSEVNAIEYRDDLNPGMYRLGEWEGKQYCVPWVNDNSALIYNREILNKLGLEPPATWEETVKTVKSVSEKTEAYGITFCGANSGMTMFAWLPFAWMNGAKLITDDGRDTTIDSIEAKEALQFWIDLAKYAPEGIGTYSYDDYYNGFITGQVAMIFGGSWHLMAIADDAPELDFGIAPFPTPAEGGTSSSFMGGDVIGITSQSKHPAEAWEFIKFCMSEDAQVGILAKNGSVPVRMSMSVDNKYFDADPRYKIFAEGGKFGRAPKTMNYNDMTIVMSTIMPKALDGTLNADAALDEAGPQIRALLD